MVAVYILVLNKRLYILFIHCKLTRLHLSGSYLAIINCIKLSILVFFKFFPVNHEIRHTNSQKWLDFTFVFILIHVGSVKTDMTFLRGRKFGLGWASWVQVWWQGCLCRVQEVLNNWLESGYVWEKWSKKVKFVSLKTNIKWLSLLLGKDVW